MLLPALNSARGMAKSAKCISNEKQIALAVLSYSNDADGQLIPFGYSANYSYNYFTNVLIRNNYLPTPKVWRYEPGGNVTEGVWRCPEVTDDQVNGSGWGGGYGVSTFAIGAQGHIFGDEWSKVMMNRFHRASQLWMIGDVWTAGNNHDPYL